MNRVRPSPGLEIITHRPHVTGVCRGGVGNDVTTMTATVRHRRVAAPFGRWPSKGFTDGPAHSERCRRCRRSTLIPPPTKLFGRRPCTRRSVHLCTVSLKILSKLIFKISILKYIYLYIYRQPYLKFKFDYFPGAFWAF